MSLRVPDDAPNELATGELWGLRWDGGWALAGETVSTTPTEVTRRFEHVDGARLEAGATANLTSWTYLDDPQVALGLDYREVTYPGKLGDYPAWLVEGGDDTWVVVLHGNGMSRRRRLP